MASVSVPPSTPVRCSRGLSSDSPTGAPKRAAPLSDDVFVHGSRVVVQPRRDGRPSILKNALSGTLGSLLAEALLFPVDTIKLQIQTAKAGEGGFLTTAAEIVQKHGPSGLFRGLSGAMVKESIHSFNFWLWHGFLFRYVTHFEDTTATHPMQRLLLNLLAKQLNWLCTVPFEVLSQVNQLSANAPGLLTTAAELYQANGIGVFYRGLPVSLLLAINPAIMNTIITSMLRVVRLVRQARGEDYEDAREHSAATVGFVTGISKAIATILTYPLIRAKVLQQTNLLTKHVALIQIMRTTFRMEGLAGLYRGLLAMSFKTVLWNSLMMSFKHILGPGRAVTPPVSLSPPRGSGPALGMMPLMAREPFPAELLTFEKFNELVGFMSHSGHETAKRVERIECQLNDVAGELRQMQVLMAGLLRAQGVHCAHDGAVVRPRGTAGGPSDGYEGQEGADEATHAADAYEAVKGPCPRVNFTQ